LPFVATHFLGGLAFSPNDQMHLTVSVQATFTLSQPHSHIRIFIPVFTFSQPISQSHSAIHIQTSECHILAFKISQSHSHILTFPFSQEHSQLRDTQDNGTHDASIHKNEQEDA
jgi:hypothetical protein